MDTRRLLLGDWNPVVRDGIDLLRLALAVGAIVALVRGETKPALVLGVFFALTLLGRLVQLPRLYDLSFVLGMSIQGWGEALGLFDAIPWFDNLVHVSVPLLTAPVVYLGLARLDVLPDPKDETRTEHYVGIFVVALALGLAIGAVWEMVEYASDATLGSSLQIDNADTVGDLFADGCGALCGSVLLVLWAMRGWGSVRRIPGENRFESAE